MIEPEDRIGASPSSPLLRRTFLLRRIFLLRSGGLLSPRFP
jgi:hypothetical protein